MKADSKERYGTVSRVFHWGMAVLILWQLMKLSDRINDGEHWVGETLVPWHISIGSLLSVLVLLRICWAWSQRRQRPEQDPAVATLVRMGHVLLYAAIVLLPITGVFRMIGKGYGWSPFGWEIVAKGPEIPWMITIGSLHSPIAWLLLFMIIGHIAIALYHHFIKKDGVLRRMA